MPQMAPISWLSLFIMFYLTFMLFNILNFYCFNKTPKNLLNTFSSNFKNNNLPWKW